MQTNTLQTENLCLWPLWSELPQLFCACTRSRNVFTCQATFPLQWSLIKQAKNKYYLKDSWQQCKQNSRVLRAKTLFHMRTFEINFITSNKFSHRRMAYITHF